MRLNGYATYVFDDKVDSYYSSTSYFEGTLKGGFEYGGLQLGMCVFDVENPNTGGEGSSTKFAWGH